MKNKLIFLVAVAVIFTFFTSTAIAKDINSAQAKIASRLHQETASTEMTSVLVQFSQDPKNTQKILLEISGCKIKYKPKHMNLLIADCPGNRILDVASDNDVNFIYEDEIYQSTLSSTYSQIS